LVAPPHRGNRAPTLTRYISRVYVPQQDLLFVWRRWRL
jgi:hypothetical protein